MTATELWDAPGAAGPLEAVVRIPGSKSVTNRALVLAALADSPTVLRGPLAARDTQLMAAALRSLGVGVHDVGPDWTVRPGALRGPATVDCGLAGTVIVSESRVTAAVRASALPARVTPVVTVMDAMARMFPCRAE